MVLGRRFTSVLLALGFGLIAFAAPTAASAAGTVTCPIGHYDSFLDDDDFPTISKLRATNLPRLTSDYAPRCLVAESVAGLVKLRTARAARKHGAGFRFDEHAPKRVWAMGARWSAGRFRVRYEVLRCDCDPYVKVTARRGKKRVRFLIGGEK